MAGARLVEPLRDYSELAAGRLGVRRPVRVSPGPAELSPIWRWAIAAAGLAGIHVHDLRHTGNHLAAISGACTRELMGRMGHVSVDAALVYQHRTASRDRAIADSLDRMVNGAWTATSTAPSTNSSGAAAPLRHD